MKKFHQIYVIMLAGLLLCAVSAFSAEVVPISYSWWPGTTAGGDDAGLTKLIDGVYGSTSPVDFNDPEYVDWYRPYWPYVLFDFGAPVTTARVTVSCINWLTWGVSPATEFQIQYSNDNVNWSSAFVFTHTASVPTEPVIEKSTANTGEHTARYVLVKFWHTGSADEPWMFVDEIDFLDSVPMGTVSGQVILDGYNQSGDPVRRKAAPVVIEFIQSGVVKQEFRVDPDQNGNFTTPAFDSGTYDVALTAAQFLRTMLPGKIIAAGTNDLGIVTLVNGDLDGDNEVSSSDLSELLKNLGELGG